MTTGYPLTIERKYGAGIVRVMAKHNLREIAAELGTDGHIDPARIADNVILRGPNTADGVAMLAKSLMKAADVPKLKKPPCGRWSFSSHCRQALPLIQTNTSKGRQAGPNRISRSRC